MPISFSLILKVRSSNRIEKELENVKEQRSKGVQIIISNFIAKKYSEYLTKFELFKNVRSSLSHKKLCGYVTLGLRNLS